MGEVVIEEDNKKNEASWEKKMKCHDYFFIRVKDGMVDTCDVFAKRGSCFRNVTSNKEEEEEEEEERKWHWVARD